MVRDKMQILYGIKMPSIFVEEAVKGGHDSQNNLI
jgi:hypothetical protein